MQDRAEIQKRIRSFKVKNAIDLRDEHVVATIHLANEHQVDVPIALDKTSPGSNDHGIDAWHYDQSKGSFFIYQSKLSNSRMMAIGGFRDLIGAADWLAQVLSTGDLGNPPQNPCIYNLVELLAHEKDSIHAICFRLISPFNHNEL